MICKVCGKYSSHTSEIDLRKFRVDGIDYLFPVCVSDNPRDTRFQEHDDAQTKIEEIVRSEIVKRKEEEEAFKQRAKEILEKQEADSKANQERVARETEEKSYRIAMSNFHELTSGYNKRAMKEIYKMLKESAENGL